MLDHISNASMRLTAALSFAASMCFAPAHLWAQSSTSLKPARSVVAASPTVDGEVQDMVVQGDSILVTYKNTGSIATTIVGELQVHVSEDEIVSSTVFADAMRVKPGATQRFKIAMPKIAKGTYTLVAVVDFGGEQMTAAMATLEMR